MDSITQAGDPQHLATLFFAYVEREEVVEGVRWPTQASAAVLDAHRTAFEAYLARWPLEPTEHCALCEAYDGHLLLQAIATAPLAQLGDV